MVNAFNERGKVKITALFLMSIDTKSKGRALNIPFFCHGWAKDVAPISHRMIYLFFFVFPIRIHANPTRLNVRYWFSD